MKLSEVKNGDTFKIGDVEFIKFYEEGERVAVVTKDTLYNSRFGDNNNFAFSKIYKELETEFLPKIAAVIGEENILEFETDLTTLDGLSRYGTITSKVSLPTFDFYRANRAIFDRYKVDKWWWLSTANGFEWWVACVAPSGDIGDGIYINNDDGVRPFCILKSNIFVSE